jgi:hypothetical protein
MEKVSKDGMRRQKIKCIIKKLGVKRQGTKVRYQRLVYFLGKQQTLFSGFSHCHNAASGARGHCAPHEPTVTTAVRKKQTRCSCFVHSSDTYTNTIQQRYRAQQPENDQ